MDGRDNNFGIDFAPIGQAIKKARIAQNMTREQLAGIIEYSIRHVQSIENEGQFPSIQLFIYLVRMFHISLDEFIFADEKVEKTSQRRQLDTLLDKLDDKELLPLVWFFLLHNGLNNLVRELIILHKLLHFDSLCK